MSGDRVIPVLFGSETGNAAGVAWQFARKAAAAGIRTVVGSMDSFGSKRIRESEVVIFIVSTTGQGDAPKNMEQVWGELRRKSCEKFDGCKYSVLGMGDSSYDKYNYIGKMLFNRLKQLGASPISDKGLSDDQDVNGLDDGLHEWISRTLPVLSPYVSITSTDVRQRALSESRIIVDIHTSNHRPLSPHQYDSTSFPVTVTSNERITPTDHFQDIRHIEFKSTHNNQVFGLEPCSSVGFHPVIPNNDVNKMLLRLNLTGDEVITISSNNEIPLKPIEGCGLIGKTVTTRQLFSKELDMLGVPTRGFFERLSTMKCNPEEHEKLLELGSADGAEELRFYCTRERRSYLEVLLDFKLVDISLAWVIECIPTVRCRQYSISSSPLSDVVSVTVAVVEYKTPYGRSKTGLCSTYLRDLKVSDQLTMSVHSPTVSLPVVDCSSSAEDVPPVVMIGPGTGVAPCTSLIKHWYDNFRSATTGKLTLIRGCRNKGIDDIYQSYFNTVESDNHWLTQRQAYSRDGESKFYCQDLIRKDSKLLTTIPQVLLQNDGFLYISGTSKDMPQSVTKAVVYCIMKYSNCSEEEADDVVNELKKYKRIQYDTWA